MRRIALLLLGVVAALALSAPARAQPSTTASLYLTPAIADPGQNVTAQLGITPYLCPEDGIQIANVGRAGSVVTINYAVVVVPPVPGAICFEPPPPLLVSNVALGQFPPGTYQVRAEGTYRGTPVVTATGQFTVLPPPRTIPAGSAWALALLALMLIAIAWRARAA